MAKKLMLEHSLPFGYMSDEDVARLAQFREEGKRFYLDVQVAPDGLSTSLGPNTLLITVEEYDDAQDT